MASLTEFNVFDAHPAIQIDWEYALKIAEGLDTTAEQKNRHPIKGKTAVRILAEYTAIAHYSAFSSNNALAVVVSPPYVWFCASIDGLRGGFIEEYERSRHGSGIRLTKGSDLFAYTNIDARLDGWDFYGQLVGRGDENETKMNLTQQLVSGLRAIAPHEIQKAGIKYLLQAGLEVVDFSTLSQPLLNISIAISG